MPSEERSTKEQCVRYTIMIVSVVFVATGILLHNQEAIHGIFTAARSPSFLPGFF